MNGATFGWNYLWGTGGAREQTKEYIETEKQQFEEQGAASYAGTAASTLAMHILGRRIGIKGKLGDGERYTVSGGQDKLDEKVSKGTEELRDLPAILDRVKEIRSQLPSELEK
ncbi:hypothetical protein OIN60_20585 [Paenibacillus sp. P96]|uniref:Uncharacterized protein n=1 Tax=Paenibacillus zeirhizosphaerae TaxID=2987519 RepID=A0ABT9FWM7_9BACL|nr:hypothetical protein [Paenibacillus sp. P96]MDP4099122.1 hypothetical protein [Paenibacillus sp. P96]